MKRFLTAVVVLATLAGCASLPESGPAQAIDRAEQVSGGAVLDPKGPATGATPEDIVSGFLQASSAGFSDDFLVARQFLTAEASAAWNPTTQIRIYADAQNPSVTQTRSGAFRVSVTASATVDASGRYTSAVPDSMLSNEFSLVRDTDGQWRIAVLDDGVTLPESLFQNSFIESPLYFLSADQTVFVPDVRWYPRSQLSASKARGLLDGPPSWLSPAVRVVVPTGTTLANPVIDIEDSIARIDLSAEVSDMSATDRALLEAQFTKTLSNQMNISGVELLANGAALDIPSDVELQSYPYGSYSLVGLRDGVPTQLTGSTASTVIDPRALTGISLADIAIGYGEPMSMLYGIDSEGSALYSLNAADSSVEAIRTGESLVPPSVDNDGWVWTAEADGQSGMLLYNSELSEAVELPAGWLADGEVYALAVSREGARIAAIVDREGVPTLVIAAITRDATGRPTAIGESVRHGQRLVEISDLAWVDEARVIVVGRTGNATERGVYSVGIGGETTAMGSVEGVVGVTAGRGDESIVLETSTGQFFVYDAGAWRLVADNVTSPAYPG